MFRRLSVLIASSFALLCSSPWSATPKSVAAPAAVIRPQATAPASQSNPFFTASTLPFQAPPFDRIKDSDDQPAIDEGMRRQITEINAIAENPERPTLANTIEAMERSGDLLTRVTKVFFNLTQSNTNDTLQKIESDEAPKLAAHQDAIYMNTELCTLHFNPGDHSPEQLIVQSLFADGHIRYSLVPGDDRSLPDSGGGFEILAVREEIVPHSLDQMTWVLSERGFQMTLSRDVPGKIASCLPRFLSNLFANKPDGRLLPSGSRGVPSASHRLPVNRC